MRRPLSLALCLLVLAAPGTFAQSSPPLLAQDNLVTFEPGLVNFLNGLLGREIGKQPQLEATPDLVEFLQGLPDLDAQIWPFCLPLGFVCPCFDLDFEPDITETFISFTIDNLVIYQQPDGSASPGYHLFVRLTDFQIDGVLENELVFLPPEPCPFTEISWTISNSFVELDIPILYVPGTGLVLQPIPPGYPVLGAWSFHVNFGNLQEAVEAVIVDELLLPLIGFESQDIESALNKLIPEQIQKAFEGLVNIQLNFENPLLAAAEQLILAVNDPVTGIPGTTLEATSEFVTYDPDGATRLLFGVLGQAIGIPSGGCPAASLPTPGSIAMLSPWTLPTTAHVSAQIPLRTIEWVGDRAFDAGLACLVGEFDFSNYVPGSTLSASFTPMDFALTTPSAGPGAWLPLGDAELGLHVTGLLTAQLQIGSLTLLPPVETAVVIDVPVLFIQSDAGETFQLQADVDAAQIALPDLPFTDPVVWQAADQLVQFFKDSWLEPLLRPVSNTPALSFNRLDLDLGAWFGPDDPAYPGVGDELDLNFGTYFAALQAKFINGDQQLRLEFDLTPVQDEPDPETALGFVQSAVPGLPDETYLAVTQSTSNPTAKFLRFGTPLLENAYRPGPGGYVRYYVLSYSATGSLRHAIQQGQLPAGPITVVPREFATGKFPYVVYTRGLTRREVGKEEMTCLDSLHLFRDHDEQFLVRRHEVVVQRLSKYGAGQDAWALADCDEGPLTVEGEGDIVTTQPGVGTVGGRH